MDPMLVGAGQHGPKLVTMDRQGYLCQLLRKRLVYDCLHAACLFFLVPGGIQVGSYFCSVKSCGEKNGLPACTKPVALSGREALSPLWEEDRSRLPGVLQASQSTEGCK